MAKVRQKVSSVVVPSLTSSLLQSADKIVGNSTINSVIDFAESYRGLVIRLYAAQKVILKMLWGESLSTDLDENSLEIPSMFNESVLFVLTEVEWVDYLYSKKFCNFNSAMYEERRLRGKRFGEVILPIGRRGSKTVMLVSSAGYLMYNLYEKLEKDFFHYFNLIKTNPLYVTFVSNNKTNSSKPYNMLKTFLEGSDFLSKYIHSSSPEKIIMLSPAGFNLKNDGLYIEGEYQLIITHSVPSGQVRGDTNIFISLDEFCFLRDSNSVKSKYLDEELYDATVPSTTTIIDPKTGNSWGMAAILSSVNGKTNQMYKLYESSFGDNNTLMFHLPSYWVNRTIPYDVLVSKHRKSPTGYMVEYESKFDVMLSSWLSDCWKDFEACINLGTKSKPCGANGLAYYAGIDFGFISDSTVIAIGHVQNGYSPGFLPKHMDVNRDFTVDNTVVVLDALIVWTPDRENILSPRQVVKSIIQLLKMFNIKKAVYDQYSKVTIEELLDEAGLVSSGRFEVLNASLATNDMLANLTKEQILSHRLEILDHDELITQFSGLIEVYKSGFVKVENSDPDIHDDIYSALSRMIYLCLTEGTKTLLGSEAVRAVSVSSAGFNRNSVQELATGRKTSGIYGSAGSRAGMNQMYGRRR